MKRRNFVKGMIMGSASVIFPAYLPACSKSGNKETFLDIETWIQEFKEVPGTKPWVYWMWMNGNITKEGITLDLEAMQRMGIGGAQCFNVGVGIPRGPVDYASETWFEMTEHAVKEAERLGMEIVLHNSSGYSGSGGPWITPEKSMQQLVWTETQVKNLKSVEIFLPKPFGKNNFYKDAFILAYPSLKSENGLVKDKKLKVFVNDVEVEKGFLFDGDVETKVRLEREDGKPNTLTLAFEEAFEARSITVTRKAEEPKDLFDGARDYPPYFNLEVSDDGIAYRNIASFGMGAMRSMDTPGMQNFPAVKARYYRLVTMDPNWISGLEFHSSPRLAGWPGKTNWTGGSSAGNPPDLSGDMFIDPAEVIDITSFTDENGLLKWEAPEKRNWTIMRIGHTTTGEELMAHSDAGKGLECDKLNREGLRQHFEKFIEPLTERLKPFAGKSFGGFMTDSWESGMQNWSENVPLEFFKRKKYDLTPWMLAMTGRIIRSVEETERFLWDMRKTQAELLAENYSAFWQEFCNQNGLTYQAEPYGEGNLDNYSVGQYLDVPMGEFTAHFMGKPGVEQAASLAHIYGRKTAAAEAYTGMPASTKWTEYPYSLKSQGDWIFSLGINRMVFHVFVHQPYKTGFPGMTMGPFGVHFDRTNTWTEQAYGWINYLRRTQFMLQLGKPVADICCFKGDDPYSIPGVDHLIPYGYSWDMFGTDALFKRFSVKNNRIVLPDGVNYRLCIMPQLPEILPETLKRIKKLVESGMSLLVFNKPEKSLGLTAADDDVKMISDDLFGDLDGKDVKHIKVGKGEIFWGMEVQEVLAFLNLLPDFSCSSKNQDALINFTHRKFNDSEIYFVCNQHRKKEHILCSFRVENRIPEIWNGESGEIISVPVWEEKNGLISLPLHLNPSDAVFVVFRKKNQEKRFKSVKKDGEVILSTIPFAPPKSTLFKNVYNNFSISFWAKPDTYAYDWLGYVLQAPKGEIVYGEGHAACGMRLGRNGVFVHERAGENYKLVLGYEAGIEGWSHIVLNYNKGVPVLYINGEKVASGIKSEFLVHPGLETPASDEQLARLFSGNSTKPVLFRDPLSDSQIESIYNNGLPDPELLLPPQINVNDTGIKGIFFKNGTYEFETLPEGKISMNIESCRETPLDNKWIVRFPQGTGAPESIEMPRLQSLHKHNDFDIRHFSGTATYETTFKILPDDGDDQRRIFLDLGRVEIIAKLWINNNEVAILWKEPFVADITRYIKAGSNELKIEITNLWVNRLIGDEHLPVENDYHKQHRFIEKLPDWYVNNQPKPGQRITFSVWHNIEKADPLLESGLLGPVKIIFAKEMYIEAV